MRRRLALGAGTAAAAALVFLLGAGVAHLPGQSDTEELRRALAEKEDQRQQLEAATARHEMALKDKEEALAQQHKNELGEVRRKAQQDQYEASRKAKEANERAEKRAQEVKDITKAMEAQKRDVIEPLSWQTGELNWQIGELRNQALGLRGEIEATRKERDSQSYWVRQGHEKEAAATAALQQLGMEHRLLQDAYIRDIPPTWTFKLTLPEYSSEGTTWTRNNLTLPVLHASTFVLAASPLGLGTFSSSLELTAEKLTNLGLDPKQPSSLALTDFSTEPVFQYSPNQGALLLYHDKNGTKEFARFDVIGDKLYFMRDKPAEEDLQRLNGCKLRIVTSGGRDRTIRIQVPPRTPAATAPPARRSES
jgi:hypothetical protein